MKICIAYKFVTGPYGGANQFLAALRDELQERGVYADNPDDADVIIANANPSSLPLLERVLPRFRHHHPGGQIIIRVDGPIALIRGREQDKITDRAIAELVGRFADGVVFQSKWSKEENERHYALSAPRSAVIPNAPDPKIFYAKPSRPQRPTRLIASSWSPNLRKGFEVYRHLDERLDWSKYVMTFVGNTPVTFRHVRILPPLPSQQLADTLREHDLYITASENDPCSNSLIEALACGLPAVARNSGGHPELIGLGGMLFTDEGDVLDVIAHAANNLEDLRGNLPKFSIQKTADVYLAFIYERQPVR